MNQVTITPTEERVRLRLRDTHQRGRTAGHVRNVVIRWLERMAIRKGRYINRPSVTLETLYEPALRETHLYAYADSFPGTMPDWLRTTKIGKKEIRVKE